MRRLILVFAGRTSLTVDFVVCWLIHFITSTPSEESDHWGPLWTVMDPASRLKVSIKSIKTAIWNKGHIHKSKLEPLFYRDFISDSNVIRMTVHLYMPSSTDSAELYFPSFLRVDVQTDMNLCCAHFIRYISSPCCPNSMHFCCCCCCFVVVVFLLLFFAFILFLFLLLFFMQFC